MRRGFLYSALLHVVVLVVAYFGLPGQFFPEPEIKVINVKLVSAPEPQKSTPEKRKKIRTQQSAAPAAPPKPEKKRVKAPQHETKVVSAAPAKKKVQVKEKKEKKQAAAKPEKKPVSRPEKLDKTKNKKNIVQTKDKEVRVSEVPPDDFLKTLDFIQDLKKTAKSANIKGEESEPTTLTAEDMLEVATIKRHIEKNWYRPPGIKGLSELSVQLEVRLNRDGTISEMQLVKSSGQSFFDDSLLRAVRKSVPLPIPTEKYDTFKVLDITFNG